MRLVTLLCVLMGVVACRADGNRDNAVRPSLQPPSVTSQQTLPRPPLQEGGLPNSLKPPVLP